MKLFSLSTTSKLYLLTLLLIFGILFLNQSVFAADQTQATTSQKRLKIMERYLSWTETREYGEFKNEPGKKILADFKTFLSQVVAEDQNCLNPENSTTTNSSFIENIRTFLSGLIPGGQNQSSNQQLSNCKGKIKTDYKLAKKYNRALKFLQIEAEQPNVCVKADLGVGTALRAKGFNPTKAPPAGGSDNPKETGVSEPLQVYLCTGNDGKKKVRVVDDSGTRLRLSSEDAKRPELQINNLPPKGSLDILLGKLGLK